MNDVKIMVLSEGRLHKLTHTLCSTDGLHLVGAESTSVDRVACHFIPHLREFHIILGKGGSNNPAQGFWRVFLLNDGQ